MVAVHRAMFLSMFAAVVFATYVAHRQFPPVLVVAALLVLLSIRILLLSGSGPELRLAIHALEFIESRTPTGTIGLLDFGFLVIGFIVQALVNIEFIRLGSAKYTIYTL